MVDFNAEFCPPERVNENNLCVALSGGSQSQYRTLPRYYSEDVKILNISSSSGNRTYNRAFTLALLCLCAMTGLAKTVFTFYNV